MARVGSRGLLHLWIQGAHVGWLTACSACPHGLPLCLYAWVSLSPLPVSPRPPPYLFFLYA